MIAAVVEVLRSLAGNAEFAGAMAARNLKSLTKGAVLGLAWLILRPFIQVAAYVVIIAYVFGVKLGSNASPLSYVLYVLSGMVFWQAVQQSLEQAPLLVRERMEVLQQVVYPIETLPLTALLVSWLGPGVGLAVYFVLAAAVGQLSWTILLLPLPLGLMVMLVLGISWLLMIAGVVLKDLREVISVVFSLMVYFSPVLLTEDMVGARFWKFILLNPFAHVVICFRDVLQGTWHATSWAVFAGLACLVFALGARIVLRTRVLINEYV
jgi:lipopolysaccharide transport system permease protein